MNKLSNIQKQLRFKLLKLAYKKQASHIPSALSMVDYFYYINRKIDYTKDIFIVGKPYGQLAYYIIWNQNNIKPITARNKKVFWAESTIGNCLGVANGVALTGRFKNIFINISDASLQEGTILEAAQFIGKCKIFKSKIILCIDFNGYQCISKNYQAIEDVKNIYTAFNWDTKVIDGHNIKQLTEINIDNIKKPLCLIFNTAKGFGINFMENDPVKWHYKKLNLNNYNLAIRELCDR